MKFRNILIGLISFAVVLVFVLFLIGILFFFQSSTHRKKDEDFTHKYQRLLFNPVKNKTSLGIVQVINKIEGDYESFRSTDGDYVLISELGSDEYKCTGSCWCDGDRRNSVGLLRKPLIFFVAAVSSYIAYDQAKKYFGETCRKDLEDACPSASIFSILDRCQMAVHRWSAKKLGDPGDKTIKYLCDGKCVPVDSLLRFTRDRQAQQEDYCQDLWDKMYVCHQTKLDGVEIIINVPVGVSSSKCLDIARVKFEQEHLKSFCSKNSEFDSDDYAKIGDAYRNYKKDDQGDHDYGFSWCTSQTRMSGRENVSCRKVEETNQILDDDDE